MTQPDACPCGPDAGLRHVNTRPAGDARPDYSYCRHCGRPIQREPDENAWTAALIGVPGRDHQCRAVVVTLMSGREIRVSSIELRSMISA